MQFESPSIVLAILPSTFLALIRSFPFARIPSDAFFNSPSNQILSTKSVSPRLDKPAATLSSISLVSS
uniref:CSON001114 protein n=1 Tax=Culicoides sonorensis TaxID=179676 RepID=A0A336MJZ0_CULSO